MMPSMGAGTVFSPEASMMTSSALPTLFPRLVISSVAIVEQTHIFHKSFVGCLTHKSDVAYPLTSGRFSTATGWFADDYSRPVKTQRSEACSEDLPILDIRRNHLHGEPI